MKRTPHHLLLVEDRKQDARQVIRALNKLGWGYIPVDVVEDGVSALDYLFQRNMHSTAERPDLILLDWMLPLKNGIEVLREMRMSPLLTKIPVIIFTTSSSESDVEEAHAAGANAYLRKPIDPKEFEDVIQALGTFWIDHAFLPRP